VAGTAVVVKASAAPRTAVKRGSYREVFRDRAFLRLAGVNLALVSAGVAPMLYLFPVFAKAQVRAPEAAIGAIYAVNTLTIVVAQMPLVRLIARRNPMRVLRAGAFIWAGCWMVCLAAGAWLAGPVGVIGLGVAAVVYAGGAGLYTAPTVPT